MRAWAEAALDIISRYGTFSKISMTEISNRRDLKLGAAIRLGDGTGTDPANLKCSVLKPAAEAFDRNCRRVKRLMSFPFGIGAAYGVLTSQLGRLIVSKNSPRNKEEFQKAMAGSFEVVKSSPTEAFNNQIQRTIRVLNQLLANDSVIDGADAWLAAQVTGAWTAFESLAEDVWERAVNACPSKLASLDGGTGKTEKSVPLWMLQKYGYDLSNKMGTVLKEKYNFDRLENMRTAYAAAHFSGDVSISKILESDGLNSLSSVRNVLVHNGGVADEEYVALLSKAPAAPVVKIDEPIFLDGEIVDRLASPVLKLGDDLITAVDNWLWEHGIQ